MSETTETAADTGKGLKADGTPRMRAKKGEGPPRKPPTELLPLLEGEDPITVNGFAERYSVKRATAQGMLYYLLEKGFARVRGSAREAGQLKGKGCNHYALKCDWGEYDLSTAPTVASATPAAE